MPTVRRFSRSRIAMYFADHPPPHFHIITVEPTRRLCISSKRSNFGMVKLTHETLPKRSPGLRRTKRNCGRGGVQIVYSEEDGARRARIARA